MFNGFQEIIKNTYQELEAPWFGKILKDASFQEHAG